MDGYVRRDNITDATLATYRGFYENDSISKEDIFYYVYGLLHSPAYKENYKADLTKMLPRIPTVSDFQGFSKAGRELGRLHLEYETITPAEISEIHQREQPSSEEEQYDYYRVTKMSWSSRKDKSRIVYNQTSRLREFRKQSSSTRSTANPPSSGSWNATRSQLTRIHRSRTIPTTIAVKLAIPGT